MSTNWDGVQYNIYSEHHDGGILQFASASAGILATLGADVDDVSQQWILHPNGEQWAYSVENWELGTYASIASDQSIRSAAEPRTWYLVPQEDGVTTSICIDTTCSRVWAPLSQVDPSQAESNDIVLVGPSGAEYEGWDIIAVGSSTTRPSGVTSIPNPSSESTVSTTTTTTTATTTSLSISTSTTTWTSSTEIGTYTQGSSTSTRPYPPESTRPVNATPGSLQALKSCAPCGSEQCTFTPSGDPSSSMYSVLIGQPVANCNSGSQESTTTKFGGKYELQRSFSVDITSQAGLGFLGPSIGTSTTVGMSNSTKTETAQEVEVTIRPGQIGALVANITYATTPGQIRVDGSTLAFVSVDPGNVLGYSVVYTGCGSAFQALTLPKVECTKNSARKLLVASLGQSTLYITLLFLCYSASTL